MSPVSLAIFFSVLVGFLWWFIRLNRQRKLPPGPMALPIMGNLHMLGTLPHLSLYNLAKKYGPIMSLRLGSVHVVTVSSAQAAKLFLKTHDTVMAGRPKVQSSDIYSYGSKGMVFTQYGAYWRNVRKFCTVELLSAAKLDSFAAMRREELDLFVENIKEAAVARRALDVGKTIGGLLEDMMFAMLFGNSRDDRFDMKTILYDVTDTAGAFNLADFLPSILASLDLQGLTRRMKALHDVIDKIMEIIVSDHEKAVDSVHKIHNKDFVDVLLTLLMNKSTRNSYPELSEMFDRRALKGIIVDMMAAGIATAQTTSEWIMSELVKNPRVMKKLQEEIKLVSGESKMVEEKDLTKLKYLDMVIKESLRLHPAAPIIHRESMEDIVADGYFIPKKSRILINTWAIGRDPDAWSENFNEFIPERFADKIMDFHGRDYELLPFGSGRRVCPGMQLGLVNVRLTVAHLVHCFSWELPKNVVATDLNMDENFGLTMPRAQPLLATPALRF